MFNHQIVKLFCYVLAIAIVAPFAIMLAPFWLPIWLFKRATTATAETEIEAVNEALAEGRYTVTATRILEREFVIHSALSNCA